MGGLLETPREARPRCGHTRTRSGHVGLLVLARPTLQKCALAPRCLCSPCYDVFDQVLLIERVSVAHRIYFISDTVFYYKLHKLCPSRSPNSTVTNT